MKPNDVNDGEESLRFLSPAPTNMTTNRRREVRFPIDLPLQLTSGSGERIPAVIRNLSAGGLLATADIRFSPLLPPPTGACFDGEFFLDDVEVRQVLLEIVHVERRSPYVIDLGCQFVQHATELSTHIRTKVHTHLAPSKRLRASSL